jgi:RNA polymerase sigma-70 factor (ECF subfamily)
MVAKNHCLMQLRNQKHAVLTMPEELSDDSINGTDYFEQLMNKEKDLDSLTESMLLLNPAQQSCIRLFYFDKKSYQEICETTGFSILQVKSYIQNGKRNLKIMLERRQQNEA